MENLIEGLAVTLVGMGTVFLVLIILYFIMIAMRYIFYKEEKQETASVKDVTSQIEKETQEEQEQEELVAILTAAIASSLNQSTYNLKIMSFRRIQQTSPVWNNVSRKEQIESKL